jgi:hypothetical protein
MRSYKGKRYGLYLWFIRFSAYSFKWYHDGEGAAFTRRSFDLYFAIEQISPIGDIPESKPFFPAGKIKSLSIIIYCQNNVLCICLQFNVNMEGIGVPDNIVDLLLNDPEKYEAEIAGQTLFSKMPVIKIY